MADRRSRTIAVRLDDRMVDDVLSELRDMPGKMKSAKRAAVKDTLRTARAELSRDIKDVANLRAKDIKDRIKPIKKPSNASPTGTIRISGSRIPLWLFSRSKSDEAGFADQKGKRRSGKLSAKREAKALAGGAKPGRKPAHGAGWKIYKGDKVKRHFNYFVRKSQSSGKTHIMKRPDQARGGNNAIPGRDYRIAYGLSLVTIMQRKKIARPSEEGIRAVLVDNLRSQVDRFLKRKKSNRA
jgi:hypothetical protein